MVHKFLAQVPIFLFRVLFVENAVLMLLEPHTTEAVFATETVVAVCDIVGLTHTSLTTENVVSVGRERIVRKLGRNHAEVAVVCVTVALQGAAMPAVFTVFQIVPVYDVLAVVEIITGDILAVKSVIEFHDFFSGETSNARFGGRNRATITKIQRADLLFIVFLRVLFIEETVFLIVDAHAAEAVFAAGTVHE
jgi:hypothetical protein